MWPKSTRMRVLLVVGVLLLLLLATFVLFGTGEYVPAGSDDLSP